MTRAAVALALAATSCTIEAPPAVPGPPSGRSVVIAAYPGRSGEDCAAVCPAPGAGEHLAQCHPTTLNGVLVEHRRALGEPEADHFTVCDYDHD